MKQLATIGLNCMNLQIGDWVVNPVSNEISRNGNSTRIEERAMRLLLYLAERPGEVVSIDQLLTHGWPGVTVSPDSVYQAITSLRRVLGDDSKQPAYIATVPRLGYRLVAAVKPYNTTPQLLPARRKASVNAPVVAAACVFLALAVFGFMRYSSLARDARQSVAVLPFLDLTEEMTQEPFADGMTEELIGKLSRIPGLKVPSPTSSFYFKEKKVTIAEVAQKLGVAYVLDGSVRKAGSRIRVAARLVRADNGYIVWTENYDRPFEDILKVQDEIAGEVAKALRQSIHAALLQQLLHQPANILFPVLIVLQEVG